MGAVEPSTHFQRPTPLSDDTCTRGCYCAYNRYTPKQSLYSPGQVDDYWRKPYEACDQFGELRRDIYCYHKLLDGFILHATNGSYGFYTDIALTTQNMTLLKYYGAIRCNETGAEGAHGAIDISNLTTLAGYPLSVLSRFTNNNFTWHWVPDGVGDVYQKPLSALGTSLALRP